MDGKELYEFTQDGFYACSFYKAGQRILLHPKQAQNELHRMRRVTDAEATEPVAEPALPRTQARRQHKKSVTQDFVIGARSSRGQTRKE